MTKADPLMAALRQLGLRHQRIRPYRPRTNGKAERLIQTLLNEWAYARIYGSSPERAAALGLYLDRYNYQRPHGSLGHRPPAAVSRHLGDGWRADGCGLSKGNERLPLGSAGRRI